MSRPYFWEKQGLQLILLQCPKLCPVTNLAWRQITSAACTMWLCSRANRKLWSTHAAVSGFHWRRYPSAPGKSKSHYFHTLQKKGKNALAIWKKNPHKYFQHACCSLTQQYTSLTETLSLNCILTGAGSLLQCNWLHQDWWKKERKKNK